MTPPWLESPVEEGFLVADGPSWLMPELTSDTAALERALAAGLPRVGLLWRCEVWLTRGPEGTGVVHLGHAVVANLDPGANEQLAEVWRAADLFDERPVLVARLSHLGPAGRLLLELALP